MRDYPNGRIPAHALKRVPGRNAGMLKPYAYAYLAWHYASVRRLGIPLTIIDGQVGRVYRSFARQVLAKQIYGDNAATPGFSNHGLGRAVDLMTQAQRTASDKIGAPFGWLKAWSDAAWEWWHLRGVKRMAPRPDPLRALTAPEKLIASRVLYHRREAIREARSGKGPRWARQVRHLRTWDRHLIDRIAQLDRLGRESGWEKANRGDRRRVLVRVRARKIT